jgi:hypothetical protein
MAASICDVRFTTESRHSGALLACRLWAKSGHHRVRLACPLRAISGLMHCNNRSQLFGEVLPLAPFLRLRRRSRPLRPGRRSGRRQGLGEHASHQPARHSGRNDCVHDPVDPARDDDGPVLGQARNPSWTQRSTVIGFIGMVAGSKPNFSKTGASIDADHGANRAAATRHKHNVPRMRGETAVRVAYAVQP